MREYKECYIAVIDLLGFKAALNKYDCETIAGFFDEINDEYIITYEKTKEPIAPIEKIHYKVMSDTICIYIETEIENSFTALIAVCDYLQVRLLRMPTPMLSKGALVKGKIYHSDDILFGEGFVRAYNMQENNHLPRVIIDDDVVKTYKPSGESGQQYLDDFIIKDVDNNYTSDYLYLFYALNHGGSAWSKFAELVTYKKQTETDSSIKNKYIYLQDQFDRIKDKYIIHAKKYTSNN